MQNIKIFAFADEASPNISEQIAAMKRNNLNGLEIRGVDGVNVSDISLEKAKEVKKQLDDNGLITWSVGSKIGKMKIEADFDKHMELFKHTLEIAAILGAENMRVFSFYIHGGENAEKYKNQVFDYLSQMCEIAKPYNVKLFHENEKKIYGDIPERCLEIHKALPELGGVFDPANFVQCGVDTLRAWEMLKNYIGYMHIKDAQQDGFVVPSGFGNGNVKEIVKDYIGIGGNRFTVEPHLTVFEGLAGLETEEDKSSIDNFKYPDADTAFDTACAAFGKILEEI